jgi:putative flavoprotein involved in K+ transport
MKYNVIIIGGSQAGLSMGFFLRNSNLSYIILDRSSEVGESWKDRYDSLKLFTPSYLSTLPGLSIERSSNLYPTKDQIADYLKRYAQKYSLPLQLNTEVQRVYIKNNEFVVETSKGEMAAHNVVVASGPFQKPQIPGFSSQLSDRISQIHSSEYKNPCQLKEGTALVIGGGNSGAQIAVELAKVMEVYLSVGHKMMYLPQDLGNKSIFWYLDKLGVYKASQNSMVGRMMQRKPDPIFGFELKGLIKNKTIKLKPRAISSEGDAIMFQDGSRLNVDNIIWATGYQPDYNWIEIPNLISDQGYPIHQRGVTSQRGLFFLGLPWLHNRSSALIQGVGKDSEYLYEYLVKQ